MDTQTKKMLALFVTLIVTAMLWTGVAKAESNAGESTVTRRFSSRSVCEGEIIEVNLDVVIGGDETIYAIEEYVPAGWTVVDDGGGQWPQTGLRQSAPGPTVP